MIDYEAIIKALDERYLAGFKSVSEVFAKELGDLRAKLAEDLAGAAARIEQLEGEKAERDQVIRSMDEKILELVEERAHWIKQYTELKDAALSVADEVRMSRDAIRDAVDSALMAMPIPKWVGVWDRAKGYQAGEMVTWDGSVWHCNEACDGERPGGTKFWTLAVKRGQDAKQPEPANA